MSTEISQLHAGTILSKEYDLGTEPRGDELIQDFLDAFPEVRQFTIPARTGFTRIVRTEGGYLKKVKYFATVVV
jgi:hypothetical protein